MYLPISSPDYELGRLLACKGDKEGARSHLDLVMSGMCDLHPILVVD